MQLAPKAPRPGSYNERSRGSDPRPLRLTMDGLLDRTLGSDPVHQGSSTSRLDLPAHERAD